MDDTAARLSATLDALARAGRTATYAELAVAAGLAGRQRIHRLTLLLEDLAPPDHDAGQPLRASLAVSRARDGLPAPGFFILCREIGRYFGPERGPQAAAFHRIECDRVFEAAGAAQST